METVTNRETKKEIEQERQTQRQTVRQRERKTETKSEIERQKDRDNKNIAILLQSIKELTTFPLTVKLCSKMILNNKATTACCTKSC